jgi:hypothetical protein
MASVSLLGLHGVSGGIALSASFIQNVLTLLFPAMFGGMMVLMTRVRHGVKVHS